MAVNEAAEKKKMIITGVIGGVVILALGYFIYERYTFYQKRVKDEKALRATLDGLIKKNEELPILKNQLAQLQIDLEAKQKQLPTYEDFGPLNRQVVKIATGYGVYRRDLKRSGETATVPAADIGQLSGAKVEKDTWKTKFEGSFFGWCKTLNDLEEHFDRFVAFENMKITPKNSGMTDGATMHEIEVDLVVYRYVPGPGQ